MNSKELTVKRLASPGDPIQVSSFRAFADLVVYMIGGFSYQTKKVTSECKRYNIKENRWEAAAALNTARGCHSSFIIGKDLFIFGGSSGMGNLNTIEILDVL